MGHSGPALKRPPGEAYVPRNQTRGGAVYVRVESLGGGYRRSRDRQTVEEEALTGEILDKFSQLITTALGLVAALAWNDAIQLLFNQLLGDSGGALAAKFFYAFLVTLIVIFATIAVSRAAERAKKLEQERDKGILGLGGGRSKE